LRHIQIKESMTHYTSRLLKNTHLRYAQDVLLCRALKE